MLLTAIIIAQSGKDERQRGLTGCCKTHPEWKMENGKAPAFFHLPFTIWQQAAVFQRPVRSGS
jgi:hypothetical protein